MLVAQLITSAASLVAILALAGLARWLGLGAEVRIIDADHAKQIAYETLYGFNAVDAVVDRAGYSALLKDADSRHALIYCLGNKFVSRLVHPSVEGRLDQKFLTLNLHEADVAPVTLNLGSAAQHWASGLRHIPNG
ncbi:MAG: hypothetical protein ACKVOJ_02275 [Sphingomonadaceae bacterium]